MTAVDKMTAIVEFVREKQTDALSLPNLHGSIGQVKAAKNGRARELQDVSVGDTIVAMEEYILITSKHVALVLSPSFAEFWRQSGCRVTQSASGIL